jgi:hypothetical protein
MKIYNPTKEYVKITILGTNYEVEPESSVDVPNKDHAYRWKNTHGFLQLAEQEPVQTETKIVEEKTEEVKEETVVEENVSDEVGESPVIKLKKVLKK